MEELYIEMENTFIPIDEKIIKKYNLKKGTLSPFTGGRIVGKNGEFRKEKPAQEKSDATGFEKNKDDEVVELDDGFMLSTSEMIDIAEGTDSTTKQ